MDPTKQVTSAEHIHTQELCRQNTFQDLAGRLWQKEKYPYILFSLVEVLDIKEPYPHLNSEMNIF